VKIETDPIGIRRSARGDQEVGSFDTPLPGPSFAWTRTRSPERPFDVANFSPEENFDSFVNKESSKCGADVRIAADAAM
jgi:hypothetical protein